MSLTVETKLSLSNLFFFEKVSFFQREASQSHRTSTQLGLQVDACGKYSHWRENAL